MSPLTARHRRVLTTHTGSLPRPDALSALLFAKMARQPCDPDELARRTAEAVAAIVKTQVDLGIDIVSDGEQGKVSFQAYAADRLSGIEPITPEPGERRTRENIAFPTFYRGGVIPVRHEPDGPAPDRSNISATRRWRPTLPTSKRRSPMRLPRR